MANVWLIQGRNATSIAASTTSFGGIGHGFYAASATEVNAQTLMRSAGVLSRLYIHVTSNDRAASTLTSRKASAAAAQSVSIGASLTGEFQDTSNTDTVVAGDKWGIQLVTGAGGTTFIAEEFGMQFAATTNTVTRFGSFVAAVYSAASTTTFHTLMGNQLNTGATNEAAAQSLFRTPGTLKNLVVDVATNTRTTAGTVTTRLNGVSQTQSVSITASTTGFFEDTSNSVTIASGDLACLQLVTGSGTGSTTIGNFGIDFVTTNNKWEAIGASDSSLTLAANTTNYPTLSGVPATGATEANKQYTANVAFAASNLRIYLSANTVSADSTVTLRKNGINTTQSLTLTANTSGWFEDTTHSDNVGATDLLSTQLVTGATGTSLTWTQLGVTAAPVIPYRSFLPILGVG